MSPVAGCHKIDTSKESLPLEKIQLPDGFNIQVFVQDLENVRAVTKSNNRSIYYAGSRGEGKVYALVDENNDYVIDKKVTLFKDLSLPTGITWHKGDLYFSEINRILKVSNIDEVYDENPKYEIVNDSFPTKEHHGWKYLKFGPDGKLYVPVGAPCNLCDEEDKRFASIMRMNADGSEDEIYVRGVRNSVGFDFHPQTGNLFFTDNGTDWMGDDKPLCELNEAKQQGQHFGYPYCHSGKWIDDKFGKNKQCDDYVSPVQNAIFIAEHGSWNRSKKLGYRVAMVRLDGNGNSMGYEIFAEGWLQNGKVWGRPADVFSLPDGSLLVTDDFANAIYRIAYE